MGRAHPSDVTRVGVGKLGRAGRDDKDDGVTPDPDLVEFDRRHVWHPYASEPGSRHQPAGRAGRPGCACAGRRARAGGRHVVVVVGHPRLRAPGARRAPPTDQLAQMAHVMFGGLTHRPAVGLARRLVEITPERLTPRVLLATPARWPSRWRSRWPSSTGGAGAARAPAAADRAGRLPRRHLRRRCPCATRMNGMHHLFANVLTPQLFADAPPAGFGAPVDDRHLDDLRPPARGARRRGRGRHPRAGRAGRGRHALLRRRVPGRRCGQLCDEHDVLLVADEIATGFGRSGAAVRVRARGRRARRPVPRQGAHRRLPHDGRDPVHRRGRRRRVSRPRRAP